jgi:hypothetical protein
MCVVAEFTINCVLGQPIPPRLVTPAEVGWDGAEMLLRLAGVCWRVLGRLR